MEYIRENMEIQIKDEEVENVAALAVAMKNLVEKYGCQAAANSVLECASEQNLESCHVLQMQS